jgi:hypothetical protein
MSSKIIPALAAALLLSGTTLAAAASHKHHAARAKPAAEASKEPVEPINNLIYATSHPQPPPQYTPGAAPRTSPRYSYNHRPRHYAAYGPYYGLTNYAPQRRYWDYVPGGGQPYDSSYYNRAYWRGAYGVVPAGGSGYDPYRGTRFDDVAPF